MKKLLVLMLAVVMCLALFSACGEKIVTKDMKELDGTEVVKVEDISVSQAYYNFIYSLVYGVTGGLGFLLAIFLFASVRERLEFSNCPKAFEGFPIALVTAGLLALAFMGFSGLKIF